MSPTHLNLDHVADRIIDFFCQNTQAVVCLWWPTASGKSSLSIRLARQMSALWLICEIISADSRQIYRGMDIGTDKVSQTLRNQVIHHQIDIVMPDQVYTSGQRKHDTDILVSEIHARGHYPLIVWGTGLYIDTMYYNFTLPSVKPDPEYRSYLEKMESDSPGVLHQMLTKVDPIDAKLHHPHSTRFIIRSLEIYHQTWKTKSSLFVSQQLPYPMLMAGIMPSSIYSIWYIDARVDDMIWQWFIDEVQSLVRQWYGRQCVAMNGIWYIEVMNYIDGLTDVYQCIRLIKQHTHQYAKKQRTWMRKYIHDMEHNPVHGVEYVIQQ